MPDFAVRPRLAREPGDDLIAVRLLLRGVLPVGRRPLAVAEAAYVDARAHVAAPRKVGVLAVVAHRLVVILSIRQVLEQSGEALGRLRARRHVERHGEAHTVVYGYPGLFELHPVACRRRGQLGRDRGCRCERCPERREGGEPERRASRSQRVRGPRRPRTPSHQPSRIARIFAVFICS